MVCSGLGKKGAHILCRAARRASRYQDAAPIYTQKLRGEVGDAIQASGLVDKRVYYELDVETGRSYFVDKERMRELLSGHPALLQEFEKEISEAAEVMVKYLLRLE